MPVPVPRNCWHEYATPHCLPPPLQFFACVDSDRMRCRELESTPVDFLQSVLYGVWLFEIFSTIVYYTWFLSRIATETVPWPCSCHSTPALVNVACPCIFLQEVFSHRWSVLYLLFYGQNVVCKKSKKESMNKCKYSYFWSPLYSGQLWPIYSIVKKYVIFKTL